MKKISISFILLLMITLFFSISFGEESTNVNIVSSGRCGENASWTLDSEGKLTISGEGEIRSGDWDRSLVSSVEIEEGITKIGVNAFAYFNNVGSFLLPSTLTSIEAGAFSYAGHVKTFVIPENVRSIGFKAFYYASIEEIYFPDGVEEIGGYGHGDTFYACRAIRYTNHSSMTAHALSKDFASFRTPGDKYDIRYMYNSQDEMTGVEISKVDKDLTGNFLIPSTITEIGRSAFKECNISGVTIEGKINNIGMEAFYQCKNLKSISFNSEQDNLKIENNAFSSCENLQSISLPEGVTEIGASAFSSCGKLESVYLPDSITRIGSRAFSSCGLKSIVLPSNMKILSEGLFSNNSSLEDITLPEQLETIESDAFYGCRKLEELTIPQSVTTIHKDAFRSCPAVVYTSTDYLFNLIGSMGVTVINPENPYGLKFIYENDEFIGYELNNVNKEIRSIEIPSTIIRIGSDAFYGCINLKSLFIPDTVTSIGDWAFSDCISLESVRLPNGLANIEKGTFDGCASLEEITIPETVTGIGEYAFVACSKLEGIILPEGLLNVGDHAFSGSGISSIVIPDGVTNAGYIPMWDGNGSFTNHSTNNVIHEREYIEYAITVYANIDSDAAKALGKKDVAFRTPGSKFSMKYIYASGIVSGLTITKADKNIVNVDIPDEVTRIEDWAFASCTSLQSVSIPDSIVYIGEYAFGSCQSLQSFWITSDNDAFGDREVFSNYWTPTIYCYEYSPVHSWAIQNNISFVLIDNLQLGEVTEITVNGNTEYELGTEARLSCFSVFPNFNGNMISYKSSNLSVATVSQDGVLTTIGLGTTDITINVNGVSKTITITVIAPLVRAINFSLEDVWLISGTQPVLMQLQELSPENADLKLTWTTNSQNIAQVDVEGNISAKAVGDTVITVTDEYSGITRRATAHIRRPVSAVSFTEPALELKKYKTIQLVAVVTNSNSSCENHFVSFSSSDESVATIDDHAVLTALKDGTATITAMAANGKYATCDVTVLPLNTLNIPTGTTSIGNEAFIGLPNIEAVRLPGELTDIALDAFERTVIVIAPGGSNAAQWADSHGFVVIEE